MEELIRQRVNEILLSHNISINKFSDGDSALQNRLSRQINRGASITAETLFILLDKFKDVSAEWLLRGEGEMYKTQSENSSMAANMQTMYEFLLEERDRKIREMEAELYLYKTQHPQKRKEA